MSKIIIRNLARVNDQTALSLVLKVLDKEHVQLASGWWAAGSFEVKEGDNDTVDIDIYKVQNKHSTTYSVRAGRSDTQ